jgi:hypothetical protein
MVSDLFRDCNAREESSSEPIPAVPETHRTGSTKMVGTVYKLKMSLDKVLRELRSVRDLFMTDRALEVTSLVVEASLREKTGEIEPTFGIMLVE